MCVDAVTAEDALVRDLVFVLDGSEGRYIHYRDTQTLTSAPAAAAGAAKAVDRGFTVDSAVCFLFLLCRLFGYPLRFLFPFSLSLSLSTV